MNLATDSTPALRRASKDAAPGAHHVTRDAEIMAAAAKLAKAAAPVMKLLARQIAEHGKSDFDQCAAVMAGTDTYEHACHVLARVLVMHSQQVAHNAAKAEKK